MGRKNRSLLEEALRQKFNNNIAEGTRQACLEQESHKLRALQERFYVVFDMLQENEKRLDRRIRKEKKRVADLEKHVAFHHEKTYECHTCKNDKTCAPNKEPCASCWNSGGATNNWACAFGIPIAPAPGSHEKKPKEDEKTP